MQRVVARDSGWCAQVREEVRVAIGGLAQDVPVCVHDGVKPLLGGVGALLSLFFANCACFLAR